MATVVYQGLQSCLESHLTETRALRLRLSSPNPHFSHQYPLELFPLKTSYSSESSSRNNDEETCNKKVTFSNPPQDKHDVGSRSFLQALSCSSPTSKDTSTIYVHPLAKCSSSVVLNEKSLALCTENLGNETGTDVMEISTDTFLPMSSSKDEEDKKESWNSRREEDSISRKWSRSRRSNGDRKRSFPPPLTSMSGGECIQVRPHREDGRLVMEATRAPPIRHLFQAERCNGRLRLSLFKESTPCDFDREDTLLKTDKEEEVVEEKQEEEEEETEEDEEEEVLFGESNAGMVGKLVMGGRCVEGEKESRGLFNRELCLVSTS